MSEVPLRAAVRSRLANNHWTDCACNVGMAMDRFAPSWLRKGERRASEDKSSFLKDLMCLSAHNQQQGALTCFLDRQVRLFADLRAQGWDVRDCRLATEWRFVSGLGIAHPFEVSFVFDHTFGVPYIPGSSVKGAARAWAKLQPRWSPRINRVFGGDNSAPDAGPVLFFDAYPLSWPRLDLDVLNPHYGDYYSGKSAPADWLQPNPVKFLTIAPGQAFAFHVAADPFGLAAKDAPQLAAWGLQAVLGAATESGLGGKSSVGYGYFAGVPAPRQAANESGQRRR